MKESLLYKIVRPIISILFKIVFRPKIIGREKIPSNGKIIIAGNHTSNLDCLLLISSTKRPIHFLAKKELWKGPKKIIFANMGLIPVDRAKRNPNALIMAEKFLDNNMVIGIFPEGTIGREGKLLPFKIGAVKMAKDTDSHIIPFVITGKYKIFSRNIQIEFLDEISVDSDDLEMEIDNLRKIIFLKCEG